MRLIGLRVRAYHYQSAIGCIQHMVWPVYLGLEHRGEVAVVAPPDLGVSVPPLTAGHAPCARFRLQVNAETQPL